MKKTSFLIAVFGLCLPVFLLLLIVPGFIGRGLSWPWLEANAQTQTVLTAEQRILLQQELAQVEAEQKQAAKELVAAQGKSASITRDLAVLGAKIRAAELDIKAKNILIQSLGNDISVKVTLIGKLEDRIERGKDTLSQILRKTNEINEFSMPELLLSQNSVSGLFTELDEFESVQQGLKSTFEQIRTDKDSTTAEKEALDARRNAALDARYAIQQQQKNIQGNQVEQKQLLALSKGAEKSYTSLIAQKQARAAQIRAALFSLRDAAAIPFGQALQYATYASQKTGVRPALILAVITQESNLGSNVGKCYVTNMQTGDGINAKTGNVVAGVMSPTRDTSPFQQILQQIGGEPTRQVVSCPLEIGWGGAMGPAQFIPSTWMIMKDQIAAAVGVAGMPDPWNPAHAFMASAIYMSNLGAGSGTYTAERNAACKYYSGSTCATGQRSRDRTHTIYYNGLYFTSKEKSILGYGISVLSLADNIQRTMIDPLQGL